MYLKGDTNMADPENDARGQYAPSQADRKTTSVQSAKPTVLTGSEYATVYRDQPGKKAS